jgi:hypothetical protein
MKNFIEEYSDYASTLSASPRKFHKMMAYAMLAQVIGRRPLYQRSGPPFGPNIWTLILAPSSTMAKSSALSIGKRILTHAYNETMDYMLPIGGSSENFFERLQDQASGILLSSEFCNLVNWFKLSYANDIPGLLIDAYDQPATIYKSIGTNHKGNKRNYIIRDAFINAYAVSSYDLFNSVINQNLLTGGFLVRWLLVREDSSDNYRAFTEPLNEGTELMLGDTLRKIMLLDNLNVNFEYEENAHKLYRDWFEDWLKKTIRESGHFFIPPYCQRRVTDLHKFAMINAVLRGSTGIMNFEDIDSAITTIQESIKDAIFLIENKIAVGKDESETNRILEYVRKFSENGDGAPHWKVLKWSKIQSFQFERYIKTLADALRIDIIDRGKEGKFYALR